MRLVKIIKEKEKFKILEGSLTTKIKYIITKKEKEKKKKKKPRGPWPTPGSIPAFN